MTPQEKAKHLLDKMTTNADSLIYKNQYAKECALIAVDEIQKLPNIQYDSIQYNNDDESQYDYWEEVKQEIEKL